MPSAWGNVFSSLGQGMEQHAAQQREEMHRAQDKAERDRQFQFMVDQAKQAEAARMAEFLHRQQGEAAASMAPSAPGGFGDYTKEQIAMTGPIGQIRGQEGMTLGSKTMQFGPDGTPMGQTQQAPKPTGKFSWRPSFDQQQSMDARVDRQNEIQGNQNFQRGMQADQHTFQQGMQTSQDAFLAKQTAGNQAFQATMQKQQIAAQAESLKQQLAGRMTPQQEMAMHTFGVMLANQPKALPDGSTDPTEWANWMRMAQGPMATLGIDLGKSAPGPAGPAAGGGGDVLNLNLPTTAPAAGGGGGFSMPNISQFLGNERDNAVENPPMNFGSGPSMSWDEINRRMQKRFPGTGNWNPFTMGDGTNMPRR